MPARPPPRGGRARGGFRRAAPRPVPGIGGCRRQDRRSGIGRTAYESSRRAAGRVRFRALRRRPATRPTAPGKPAAEASAAGRGLALRPPPVARPSGSATPPARGRSRSATTPRTPTASTTSWSYISLNANSPLQQHLPQNPAVGSRELPGAIVVQAFSLHVQPGMAAPQIQPRLSVLLVVTRPR